VAPLFVFAREPGSKGPPLVAKRLTSPAIGTQIHLSAADSMITYARKDIPPLLAEIDGIMVATKAR
jgi:hypothetical protein